MSTGQNNKLRLPAEWEPVDAVLKGMPHRKKNRAKKNDQERPKKKYKIN